MKRIPIQQLKPDMYVVRAEGVAPHKLRPGRATSEKIELLRKRGVQSVVVSSEGEFRARQTIQELQRVKSSVEDINRSMKNIARSVRTGGTVPVSTIREMTKTIMTELSANQDTLLNVINLKNKDAYTYEHSIRVGIYSIVMAMALERSEKDKAEFGMAGILHDIGKLALPSSILRKKTGLTSFEERLIKEHPISGRSIIANQPDISREVCVGVEQHHERMDGAGYTRGLRGDEISLVGRILGIVDTYDAITSDRSYRQARSSYAAFCEMRTRCAVSYDIELLDRFVKRIGIYAPGTIVRLTNGRFASVIGNTNANLLKPRVFVHGEVSSGRGSNTRLRLEIVDLSNREEDIMKVVEPTESAYPRQKALSMSILANAGNVFS